LTDVPAYRRAGEVGPVIAGRDLNEAGRGRATLALGILAFRWASVGWMTLLAVLTDHELRRPAVAWLMLAAAAAWNGWLTLAPRRFTAVVLGVDLALAVALTVLPAVASEPGRLSSGNVPAYENPYPVAAALTWGVAAGTRGGLLAGVVIGLSLVAARVVNGAPVDLGTRQVLNLASGSVNFLLAGGGVGLVGSLLERSWAREAAAQEESARARERAARLAEREALARRIHDSVLQSLAMVHKHGRELAAAGPVPAEQVARLAELAGGQERALRALVLHPDDGAGDGQPGRSSLRAALEELAIALPAGWPGCPPVTVSAVGPLWLPAACAAELRDAVRQALENAAEHAAATRISIFAEEHDGEVVVTVRDDGAGFVYDEPVLRAAGKIGLLSSIKGRARQLGGDARVETAPGGGTEIELRVPAAGPALAGRSDGVPGGDG
jgi:signal transduction histidine kinase